MRAQRKGKKSRGNIKNKDKKQPARMRELAGNWSTGELREKSEIGGWRGHLGKQCPWPLENDCLPSPVLGFRYLPGNRGQSTFKSVFQNGGSVP